MIGLPLREGSRISSTDAKKASKSRWRMCRLVIGATPVLGIAPPGALSNRHNCWCCRPYLLSTMPSCWDKEAGALFPGCQANPLLAFVVGVYGDVLLALQPSPTWHYCFVRPAMLEEKEGLAWPSFVMPLTGLEPARPCGHRPSTCRVFQFRHRGSKWYFIPSLPVCQPETPRSWGSRHCAHHRGSGNVHAQVFDLLRAPPCILKVQRLTKGKNGSIMC